ncbi:MAG: hypothetical protein JSV09_04130, partial [Thermoplasmata archaeon]
LFLEDLYTIYRHLEEGDGVFLPRHDKRFKNWVERYMDDELQHEAEDCKDRIIAALPKIAQAVDLGEAAEPRDKKTELMVALEEEKIERFSKALDMAKISAEELILIALAKSLNENDISEILYVDCISAHTLDSLKRTNFEKVMGNLSTSFPLFINIRSEDELHKIIIKVKEGVRNFKDDGEHYGILRHTTENEKIKEEMRRIPKPLIKFSYNDGSTIINPIYEYKEVRRYSMQNYSKETFPYVLEIDALKMNDRLHLHLSFDPSRGSHEVVLALGAKLLEEINSIVDFILTGEKVLYVPGDFPEADWDSSELNDFLEAFARNI